MLKRHPCELRADFQQYYGLCIDDMGRTFSVRHAGELAVMLPRESRVAAAIDPANCFGVAELLATTIANGVNDLVWLNTKDGQKGVNRPKRIVPPGAESDKQGSSLDVAEYERILNMPRKEASYGD